MHADRRQKQNRKEGNLPALDSGTICFWALHGHSGRNLIDPSLQDNVVNSEQLLRVHLSRRMCNQFTLHFNSGFNTDPMDKSHKDPKVSDLNVPRHAQYLHNALKRHQDAVYWVDINLAIEKGLKFYRTRWYAIILQEPLPVYYISKVVYMPLRPPPKISFKHEWKRELGSEHAQRPEGQVVQPSRSSQSSQPTLNPIRERSGRLDSTQDGRNTSPSQEIDLNSFFEPSSSERLGRPVETNVNPTRSSEDRKDFNVEQTRERMERPVNTHDLTSVTDSSQTRSAHESETLNVEDEILSKRTERSVADHDVSHESMIVNEADMGLPNSSTTTFRFETRARYQRSTIDSEN